ncbi:hypothetical protein ACFVRU_29830 [Streptomyces sp. NPDC057927]
MARQVKCQLCGNKGYNTTFYCVEVNDKNKYYCNEEELISYKKQKDSYNELIEYVSDEIIGYEKGQKFPTSLVRRIAELHKFYSYEVIKYAFQYKKDDIIYYTKTKDFKSEYNMISYIMAIVEGSINDVYKAWKRKQEQELKAKMVMNTVDVDLYSEVNGDVESKRKVVNSKNISSFLDESDM